MNDLEVTSSPSTVTSASLHNNGNSNERKLSNNDQISQINVNGVVVGPSSCGSSSEYASLDDDSPSNSTSNNNINNRAQIDEKNSRLEDERGDESSKLADRDSKSMNILALKKKLEPDKTIYHSRESVGSDDDPNTAQNVAEICEQIAEKTATNFDNEEQVIDGFSFLTFEFETDLKVI